jgi:predicted transcriptional regulator
MKVVLSIKPEFVEKIFEGTKKYEYRRTIFRQNVETIVIYASAPISKAVGEFDVGNILHDDLQKLWDNTKNYSGTSKDCFLDYFSDKDKGYAIEIISFKKYQVPICIKEKFGMAPPQSFAYIYKEE